MAGSLSAAARQAIAEQMRECPGRATAARLAAHFGCSVATVYRHAAVNGPRRRRPAARPEYRDWVTRAVWWAHRAPEPMSLEDALRAALGAGDLPAAAADMPLKTAERIRRDLGLAATSKRTHRLHAEWPMQAVLLDASTSQYLVVDGPQAGAGEATRLKLHRAPLPASGYKNKPLPPDRRRVLVYALWDLCTGVYRSRYVVARGENALDAVDFLCWALRPSPDRRVVLHGAPDDLWVDQGPLLKSAAARDLLERLEIGLVLGAPYAKERMGGVERTHRTRWRSFERPLFARAETSITLGALNERLVEFEVREHARRPSRTPVDGRLLPRAAAWVALVNRRPADRPLRRLPERPVETLAREARRKVDVNGIVRWGGVLYESREWHDRWVVAHRAADGSGDLTLTDERTGAKAVARRFAPRAYGAVAAVPATPLDRLLSAEAPAAGRGADIHAPAADGAPPAVVPLPARTAPAAALRNPLAGGDRCRDIDEAMALFNAHCGRLSPAQFARVRTIVAQKTGLVRQAVINLAQELQKAV